MNNLWNMFAITHEILREFEESSCQMACMVMLYPWRVYSERVDEIYIKYRQDDVQPPIWYEEREWPKAISNRSPECPYGFGDPALVRQLQGNSCDIKERCYRFPPNRILIMRQRLDSGEEEDQGLPKNSDDKKNWKTVMQAAAKEVIGKLRTHLPKEQLGKLLHVKNGDVVDFAVALFWLITNKGTAKLVTQHFAPIWPED